jgi:phenylalanyl-tRNA synthetase beta chain
MGDDATAVSDATRHVYVEAAFWWPKAIAGRSRRYNFSTDAGHRFERGVDPSGTVEHIERITQLILDICGGEAGPVDDFKVNLPVSQPVTLRVARAGKVIGMPLTQAQCTDALTRLGLPVSAGDGTLTVTPPSFRFDLTLEEDLIEEVARVIGYDHLPATPPLAPITPKIRPEGLRSPFAVRRALAALGYQETINFSFVDERWERELAGNERPIELLNPIASQMGVMRSSLIGSLLQVLRFNADRKAARVRVFEVGRVFLRDPAVKNTDTTVEGFNQPMRVAGIAWGGADPLQWAAPDRAADFFDVRGDVEALLAPTRIVCEPATHPAMHPGRCASVSVNGKPIGYVGELHPRWRQSYGLTQAPVLFELDLDAVLSREVPVSAPVAKYQAVERDIAVIVAEQVTHAALLEAIWSAPTGGLLRDAMLFDVYRAKQPGTGLAVGEKSLAVRLTLNGEAGTLTDPEIDGAVQAIVAALQSRLGARLRG